MGDAVNRQSQRLQLAHLIHGGIDRGSLSTIHFEQSNQWSVTHTSTKETRKHKINHQRNQDYSPDNFSENEVSVVL
jgi:hypothetical protein